MKAMLLLVFTVLCDTLSLGNESSTFIIGHAQTDWISVKKVEAQASLKHENLIGKTLDIEIKGTSAGLSKGDVSMKLIDSDHNSTTIIDKFDIKIDGYQLSSTKVRGTVRYQATKKVA